MRILITGGCGFLGSHLVEHFLKNTDHDIVVLDKLTYASSGFDRLRDVASGLPSRLLAPAENATRLHVIGCDLSQPIPKGVVDEAHGTLGNGGIDYIIHAAAESHVDNSITDPLPFLMSNVIGTHHLLMSELVMGVQRTFMVSTDEVYGPAEWDYEGYTEYAPYRPANPYAASKAGAECVAFSYANTYGLPVTIVNTMNLIGERQHPEKFVPLVIRKVLAGETVTIHADPTKTRPGTRFYLHCRTFANALGWLIDKDRDGMVAMRTGARPGDVYAVKMPSKIHVCGEREMSNLELAQTIAGFVGKELKYELVDFHSSRPGHDLRYAMDDSKIRGMGWERPMGILDSLKKTVGWYLANPRWLELAPKQAKPLPWAAPVPGTKPAPAGARDGAFLRYAAGEEVKYHDIVIVEGRGRAGTVTGVCVSPPMLRVDLSEMEALHVDPVKCNLIRRADAPGRPPLGTEPAAKYQSGEEILVGDRVIMSAPHTAEHGAIGDVQSVGACKASVTLATGMTYLVDVTALEKLRGPDGDQAPWADELNEAAIEELSQYVALGPDDDDVQAEPRTLRDHLVELDDSGYQAGIFADPLGADHLRDQVCRSEIEDIRERVDALESASQRERLKKSAYVEIVDGFLVGCRGVVSDVVGTVPLYEVELTWAPNGDGAKYLNSHVVLPAEQLKVVP